VCRMPRGNTQNLAMLIRFPDVSMANVSRRTTKLCTYSGCRDARKTFVSSAWRKPTCHQDAQLWALPYPASQCYRHKELEKGRQRAALTDTSLPDLSLRYMAINDGVCTSVAEQELDPPQHGSSAPSSLHDAK
jgi:hypothetical protein